MHSSLILHKVLVCFLLICVTSCWTAALASKSQLKATTGNGQQDLVMKIRSTPKEKLNRYKLDAAKRLQANLIRTFQALSTTKDPKVPANVKTAAKSALAVTQSGKMTSAIVNSLPVILQQGSQQQGNPAQQLGVILGSLIPNAPPGAKGPLQGLLDFVSANLAGVNTLLLKLLGGVPSLLDGVIKSLATSLGAVSDAVNGSLGSLGLLMGGALVSELQSANVQTPVHTTQEGRMADDDSL